MKKGTPSFHIIWACIQNQQKTTKVYCREPGAPEMFNETVKAETDIRETVQIISLLLKYMW